MRDQHFRCSQQHRRPSRTPDSDRRGLENIRCLVRVVRGFPVFAIGPGFAFLHYPSSYNFYSV